MFWDPYNGTLLKILKRDPDAGEEDYVHSVSFSNDGKTLMSAGNKDVLLWSFDLESLLLLGCEQLHDYLKTHPQDDQPCSGPELL